MASSARKKNRTKQTFPGDDFSGEAFLIKEGRSLESIEQDIKKLEEKAKNKEAICFDTLTQLKEEAAKIPAYREGMTTRFNITYLPFAVAAVDEKETKTPLSTLDLLKPGESWVPQDALCIDRVNLLGGGWGVFAVKTIPPGTVFGPYSGFIQPQGKEGDPAYRLELGPEDIDAKLAGNAMRFFNHSFDPQVIIETRGTYKVFIAIRTLFAGEQACFNYNIWYPSPYGTPLRSIHPEENYQTSEVWFDRKKVWFENPKPPRKAILLAMLNLQVNNNKIPDQKEDESKEPKHGLIFKASDTDIFVPKNWRKRQNAIVIIQHKGQIIKTDLTYMMYICFTMKAKLKKCPELEMLLKTKEEKVYFLWNAITINYFNAIRFLLYSTTPNEVLREHYFKKLLDKTLSYPRFEDGRTILWDCLNLDKPNYYKLVAEEIRTDAHQRGIAYDKLLAQYNLENVLLNLFQDKIQVNKNYLTENGLETHYFDLKCIGEKKPDEAKKIDSTAPREVITVAEVEEGYATSTSSSRLSLSSNIGSSAGAASAIDAPSFARVPSKSGADESEETSEDRKNSKPTRKRPHPENLDRLIDSETASSIDLESTYKPSPQSSKLAAVPLALTEGLLAPDGYPQNTLSTPAASELFSPPTTHSAVAEDNFWHPRGDSSLSDQPWTPSISPIARGADPEPSHRASPQFSLSDHFIHSPPLFWKPTDRTPAEPSSSLISAPPATFLPEPRATPASLPDFLSNFLGASPQVSFNDHSIPSLPLFWRPTYSTPAIASNLLAARALPKAARASAPPAAFLPPTSAASFPALAALDLTQPSHNAIRVAAPFPASNSESSYSPSFFGIVQAQIDSLKTRLSAATSHSDVLAPFAAPPVAQPNHTTATVVPPSIYETATPAIAIRARKKTVSKNSKSAIDSLNARLSAATYHSEFMLMAPIATAVFPPNITIATALPASALVSTTPAIGIVIPEASVATLAKIVHR